MKCTCHVFDIGPRCEACVAACSANGHPFTERKTNGVNCPCGTPPDQRLRPASTDGSER